MTEPAEKIARGALRFPPEVKITTRPGGPKIGTARLRADDGGIVADIELDGDQIRAGSMSGLSFHIEHHRAEAVTIPEQAFTYTPLGPWTDDTGKEWCCGLHCGKPCPYRKPLRTRPGLPPGLHVEQGGTIGGTPTSEDPAHPPPWSAGA